MSYRISMAFVGCVVLASCSSGGTGGAGGSAGGSLGTGGGLSGKGGSGGGLGGGGGAVAAGGSAGGNAGAGAGGGGTGGLTVGGNGGSPSGGGSGGGGVAGSNAANGGSGGGSVAGSNAANGGSGGGGVAGSNAANGGAGAGGVAGSNAANGGAGAGGGGGANAGLGGSSGSAGAGGAGTTFVCNQAMPLTLTRQWFEAGFETDPGIVGARWQLKAREHGYITEWANPTSDFWNEMIESPCTNGSTNPDHVVLTVLSWTCCTTQAEWETQIDAAITNLKARYSALKRIDLMTITRGPNNMACPMAPNAGQTIVVPPELDAALAATATKMPGFVFVAPKFEAPSCSIYTGGGPDVTPAGSVIVAKMISAYFVNLQ